MVKRLENKLRDRKFRYELRKRAHEEAMKAKKAEYEKKGLRVGIGIRGIGISPTTARALTRYRLASTDKLEVLKSEIEEKPPLVDVVEEPEHLRITLQLSDISLPHDITIDEITDVSFKHGILEIRLKKREEKLSEEEKLSLAETEEEITAEIKKKVLVMLKKRKAEKEKFIA
ncbi:MAG: hypothetical protein AB1779_03590 [Candidatus Thermoplasmatota archaeon]